MFRYLIVRISYELSYASYAVGLVVTRSVSNQSYGCKLTPSTHVVVKSWMGTTIEAGQPNTATRSWRGQDPPIDAGVSHGETDWTAVVDDCATLPTGPKPHGR